MNQALGAGLAIVCSEAVGAAHDLIEEGVNGTVFCTEDEGALLAKMRELAADPALAVRWGEASRRKATDWEPAAGAKKWVKVLEAITEA